MHDSLTKPNLCFDTRETSQDRFPWPKSEAVRGVEDKIQFG